MLNWTLYINPPRADSCSVESDDQHSALGRVDHLLVNRVERTPDIALESSEDS